MKNLASQDSQRWIILSEILAFNKMRVLTRGLDHEDFIKALQRHQKNFAKCTFELSEDL
jgi:hypothetical protein